ncbi:MAG: class I SAM-dependent methyltransferase, partial [Parachlamydiaceae bacterium]
QEEMFTACTRVDSYAQSLFRNPPYKVLDLGSGIGANTLPMAKAGSHVTAIDQSKEFLSALSKNSTLVSCPVENLRLRRGDIVKMESYGGPFNLVVAIDILPYVPPKSLKSTMKKIHDCLEERGTLIGTIFTTNDQPMVREMMTQLGAYFYPNGVQFVSQFLKFSGFKEIEIEAREEGGFRFKAEKVACK